MAEAHKELTLDELLADPIVQLVMRRDGVTTEDVRKVIERARQAQSANSEGRELRTHASDMATGVMPLH
jgi:hypothetical protein